MLPKILLHLIFLLASNHQVTLNWDPSSVPNLSYYVFRGPTAGGELSQSITPTPVALNCNSRTACTWVDTAVSAGQTYYYTVEAYNGTTLSGPSNETIAVVPVNPATDLTIGDSH